ncbi:MAG: site-specific integrase [Candidatus Omnitrophica bacterium]|nr:site-specific integrase [Candidatus Omnitrophota bacterium]
MPYKHFSEGFLRHYEARYPYETYKSHKSAVNEFTKFLESSGITRLSEITTAVVNNYVTYLRTTKGDRANTCNNHLKNLQTQFNFAIKNGGLMKNNPAKDAKKVEINDAKKKGALSAEEYQRFMEVAEERHLFYYPIFYTFLHTGLRFTELISLRWEDIDWKAKTLWVMKPKGKKKPEPISIHDSLIKTLQSLPKRGDYVFMDEDGKPFCARTRKLVRRLKDILKEAGITSISTLHELRHTYCSQLFRVGFNPREVQRQMRHSELGVTEGYAHIFMPEYNKKIDRLQRLDKRKKG